MNPQTLSYNPYGFIFDGSVIEVGRGCRLLCMLFTCDMKI
jgi:hypothetical protein